MPVYWGAPDIASSIPADCFIAREAFGSEAELYAFLKDMPASVHEGYLKRIRAFLSSERAIPYSAEHFIRTFVGLVGRRTEPRDTARFASDSAGPVYDSADVGAARVVRDRE